MTEQTTRYKQTEIGLIPEDWEVRKLGELGDVKMCKRIFQNQTSEFGEIPFYKIGTFGKLPDAFISRKIYEDYKNRFSYPSKGCVLISAAGTIGRTVVYYDEESYYQDSNIVWIDNKETIVSNKLLRHILDIVNYNTEGGTIQRLYNSILRNTIFACPPLPEQQVIATALSDCDAWIDSQEKRLAKKRLIKQGAMQQLLSPKENWEVKKLGEIGKTFGGLSGKAKEDFGIGDNYYLPFLNIINNVVIDKCYIEKVKIKQGEYQNKVLKGDLLFNGSSETPEELGISSVLLDEINDLYLNSFCFGYRLFNKEINPLYISYLMRSTHGRKIIFHLAQGATRYNLSKSNFLELEIPFPSLAEQTRIATILSDMDAEITAMENELAKSRQIKQGMMQELLTGKRRLPAVQTGHAPSP
ncbi:MAG: restriction endonuclease subunit S [Bacteroidetes bacterium]|nr:restriction endonuclease subunit S [Bacteroidota bacterium]